RFAEDVRQLRARGIQVIALVMVGLDGATTETFAATLRWLEEHKISSLKLFTPAPYPGTKLHADIAAAARILTVHAGRRASARATRPRPAPTAPAVRGRAPRRRARSPRTPPRCRPWSPARSDRSRGARTCGSRCAPRTPAPAAPGRSARSRMDRAGSSPCA